MKLLGQYITCPTPEDLTQVAIAFSKQLKISDICLLDGEMGAGKTYFSSQVYLALGGHPQYPCSPTFTLVNQYPLANGLNFFHVDLYRLEGVTEEDELDQDDWMNPTQGYSFIEWPERMSHWKPERGYRIQLEHLNEGRSIRIDQL